METPQIQGKDSKGLKLSCFCLDKLVVIFFLRMILACWGSTWHCTAPNLRKYLACKHIQPFCSHGGAFCSNSFHPFLPGSTSLKAFLRRKHREVRGESKLNPSKSSAKAILSLTFTFISTCEPRLSKFW